MNILDLKTNQTGEITSIRNRENPSIKVAEAMGLREGETVQLSQTNGRNLVVVTLGGGTIIIDKDIAKHIEIQ